MEDSKKHVSLRELIHWVKQELLSEEAQGEDPVPLFVIDEVTVEVNFVVDGKLKSGFSAFKVVEVGSEVAEQRVQKATIKMTPILNREQIIDEWVTADPERVKVVKSQSVKAYLKGRIRGKETAPKR